MLLDNPPLPHDIRDALPFQLAATIAVDLNVWAFSRNEVVRNIWRETDCALALQRKALFAFVCAQGTPTVPGKFLEKDGDNAAMDRVRHFLGTRLDLHAVIPAIQHADFHVNKPPGGDLLVRSASERAALFLKHGGVPLSVWVRVNDEVYSKARQEVLEHWKSVFQDAIR
jgi:hypothetical protein